MPIASDPSAIIRPPTQSTAAIATMPRNSIPGKKSEFSHCACVFVRAVRVVRLVELAEKRALAVERLDHGHARDRLRDLRRHRGDRLAHAQECGVRRTWNQRVRTSVGGRITSATSAEPPVEDEEADDRGDQRERVDDERRQPLRQDVRERVDVAR